MPIDTGGHSFPEPPAEADIDAAARLGVVVNLYRLTSCLSRVEPERLRHDAHCARPWRLN